jgi:hypothetical protein
MQLVRIPNYLVAQWATDWIKPSGYPYNDVLRDSGKLIPESRDARFIGNLGAIFNSCYLDPKQTFAELLYNSGMVTRRLFEYWVRIEEDTWETKIITWM